MVDARDPLTYRSEDLERYARHLHPFKASLLLLNKADLLPEGGLGAGGWGLGCRLGWAGLGLLGGRGGGGGGGANKC